MKGSSGWRIAIAGLLCASVCGVLLLGLWGRSFFSGSPATQRSEEAGSAGLSAGAGATGSTLQITYPPDEALFPPEIVEPTFRWHDENREADAWAVTIEFADRKAPLKALSRTTEWMPSPEQWAEIKARSVKWPAKVTVAGVNQAAPDKTLSSATILISTSRDEVGAPLFFREVNLPFLTAVYDPARHIRWRFGPISAREPPPIVLEKLAVCGNCHSFSRDGTTLAMEVDSGNQKGGYTIAPVTQEIVLDPTKILDWNEYKRNDGQPTFGLLCQISPDGRYVAGTVKDRALALYQADLMFSQLFFLVKGITAIYDRETKTISALPGADDPEYVQTNATWSPDGKYIVFARSRSKAFETETMRKTKSLIVPQQEGEAFLKGGKTFLFDLYRIPFNDGKGGKAEPIPGASNNGMSNYFAKYSPDGKWIVFCKARSFMLLQPDSQLYIIPAAGGQARRLRCNTARMNSWHSWSPNGRWLVFSSKVNGPYTQLFLTHIDAEGNSTPPVVLDRFTAPERAANIPEFVNQPANAIRTIREAFMDDHSHWRVGREFEFGEDWKSAERMYRMALKINPRSRESHESLGLLLFHRLDQQEEGLEHLRTVLQLAPEDVVAHYNVGSALANMGRVQEAVGYFEQALKLKPDYADARRNLDEARADAAKAQATIRQCEAAVEQNPDSAEVLSQLANALMNAGRGSEAIGPFERAVALNPKDAGAHNSLAWLLATKARGGEGNPAKAVSLAKRACELTGNNSAGCLDTLAVAHAAAGQFPEAIAAAEKAIQLATAAGQVPLASRIEGRLESYRAGRAYDESPPAP